MQKLFFIMLCITFLLYGCDEQLSGLESDIEPDNMYRMRDRAIEIVRKGLTDQSDLIKIQAVEVVAITGRTELMPMVTPLLKSDSVSVRSIAAIAIGDMKYLPGEFAVRRLLNDTDENARTAAAYAMTKLGSRDFDSLIKNALTSKDPTVGANAALLLGKLGDKKNLELLYSTLYDPSSSTSVKMKTVAAIATLGDDKIYQKKLWALLISKYSDVRIIGIRAMGALGTADAKNAIVTMLNDDIPEVKLCAAEELGRLRNPTGQVEVLEYFKEISPGLDSIRRNEANVLAAMAIGRIGTRELVKYLPKLLKSRSKKVQLSASQAVLLLIR